MIKNKAKYQTGISTYIFYQIEYKKLHWLTLKNKSKYYMNSTDKKNSIGYPNNFTDDKRIFILQDHKRI